MASTPAFVTGLVRSSFIGNVVNVKGASTCSAVSMSMKKEEKKAVSRREALIGGAALLAGIPLSALAKGGDSPKISIFGVGGASSPFDAGFQTGGKVLYSEFSDDELAVFKRIVNQSQERIVDATDSIKARSWEDIRSRCRLEAYDLRKIILRVNDAIADQTTAAKAKKIAKSIKDDIEQLDQACVAKNQDLAYKKYNATVKDIAEWKEFVGF